MNRKLHFIIIAFFLIISACKNSNERGKILLEEENSYWMYAPVTEFVDKNTESINYSFTDTQFNKNELKVLISVLEKKGYKYKITLDTQVMISKISVSNLQALYSIRGEIKNALKDTTQTWRWK